MRCGGWIRNDVRSVLHLVMMWIILGSEIGVIEHEKLSYQTNANPISEGATGMPFKTAYGTHYHETFGCHGATIPCDAKGLTPCADCCGSSDGGTGSQTAGGGMTAGHSGNQPGSRAYASTESKSPATPSSQAAMEEARVEHAINRIADSEVAEKPDLDCFERQQLTSPSAPSGIPERMTSSPDRARKMLAASAQTLYLGRRTGWHRLPVIGFLGESLMTTIGSFSLAIRNKWNERRKKEAQDAIMSHSGCSRWEAQCVMVVERGERLARTRQEAEDSITRQMTESQKAGNPRTREAIIVDNLMITGNKVMRRWGISDGESLGVDGYMGLVAATNQAIEETGYGDKITPEVMQAMRRRLLLRKGSSSFLTAAMEDARDNEWLRTHEAKDVMRGMRTAQG